MATVRSIHVESARVKLFRLELPKPTPFRAGQYFDIRLTAPDGYQAQRSYSVTSSPYEDRLIEFAIELIEEGEVSSYFHKAVEPGEQIELRGPIGGHFTLSPNFSKPVLLIAGGSGIAPIISMLRHRNHADNHNPIALMFSARTEDDLLFRREIESMADGDPNFQFVPTLTRSQGPSPFSNSRRIDRAMIDSTTENLGHVPTRAYICGGSDFVETMGNHLLDIGLGYNDIRTERFGP